MHPRDREVWRPSGPGSDRSSAGERPLLQGHLKRRRGAGPATSEAAAKAAPATKAPAKPVAKAASAPKASAAKTPKASAAKAAPKRPRSAGDAPEA